MSINDYGLSKRTEFAEKLAEIAKLYQESVELAGEQDKKITELLASQLNWENYSQKLLNLEQEHERLVKRINELINEREQLRESLYNVPGWVRAFYGVSI